MSFRARRGMPGAHSTSFRPAPICAAPCARSQVNSTRKRSGCSTRQRRELSGVGAELSGNTGREILELNRLASEPSACLKSAAHQPVHWLPWGEAAFARAQTEHKPILLDIGAVWCHWCHVMDGESYEDSSIAEILNRDFVCIKVDRDERPDVDARYQRAVQALSGQGGWPLTAFLTPEGEVFFGGTYFPPDNNQSGRPGFRRVLMEIPRAFREEGDRIPTNAPVVPGHVPQTLTASRPER